MTDASAGSTFRAPVPDLSTMDREPRWPAAVAVLAAAGLYFALPEGLSVGPSWLVPAVAVGLLAPALVAHWTNRQRLNQQLGFLLLGVLTAGLVTALALLVRATVRHSEQPIALLGSAVALWSSNVLVFASWYWRIDAGGPHARDVRAATGQAFRGTAFLFPQLTLPESTPGTDDGIGDWRPGFVDYLFVAFNTSTAFSPTDAPVLDRWAKVLMMAQASISLITLAVLAARAVNIL